MDGRAHRWRDELRVAIPLGSGPREDVRCTPRLLFLPRLRAATMLPSDVETTADVQGADLRQQLEFLLPPAPPAPPRPEALVAAGRLVPLWLVKNRRARRYILRLRADGSARVTIPRGGSAAEARAFVRRHLAWLEKQLQRQAAQPPPARTWPAGTEVLYRGEHVRLQVAGGGRQCWVQLAEQMIPLRGPAGDLRPVVERHLWRLAAKELPAAALVLAAVHQVAVQRVMVRNQRSRWGSCSRRRTVSLNWRLIQTPVFVRDYLIIHELMHLREMNHSPRFWQAVERACPNYAAAERWLKEHRDLLH